jgi:hypothetical protein
MDANAIVRLFRHVGPGLLGPSAGLVAIFSRGRGGPLFPRPARETWKPPRDEEFEAAGQEAEEARSFP